MSSRQNLASPDLSTLKIDENARGRGGIRWLRYLAAVVGVLLLIVAGVVVLRGRMPEVEVAAAVASSGRAQAVLLNASGYVTPRRRSTVAAQVTGRVIEINAEEGMHVRAGDVLARLYDQDIRARLASAEADRDATRASLADLKVNLADGERELSRTESLRQSGVFSQQQLDTARTRVDSLKAQIAQTEQQVQAADAKIGVVQQDLVNTVIRAPFDGIVVSKDAQRGEIVSPVSAGGGFTRTGIATIVDMKSLEIEVDVNESYIARVTEGQPAIAVLDAYPGWEIPAKVRTVIPTADRQKATVKVRLTFDHLDPRILPDMGVKVRFLESEKKEDVPQQPAVLIPSQAVRQDAGQPIVFVYRDDRVERRAVKLGGVQGSNQEVVAGLSAGDQVVTSSAEALQDGQRVELKK